MLLINDLSLSIYDSIIGIATWNFWNESFINHGKRFYFRIEEKKMNDYL